MPRITLRDEGITLTALRHEHADGLETGYARYAASHQHTAQHALQTDAAAFREGDRQPPAARSPRGVRNGAAAVASL